MFQYTQAKYQSVDIGLGGGVNEPKADIKNGSL